MFPPTGGVCVPWVGKTQASWVNCHQTAGRGTTPGAPLAATDISVTQGHCSHRRAPRVGRRCPGFLPARVRATALRSDFPTANCTSIQKGAGASDAPQRTSVARTCGHEKTATGAGMAIKVTQPTPRASRSWGVCTLLCQAEPCAPRPSGCDGGWPPAGAASTSGKRIRKRKLGIGSSRVPRSLPLRFRVGTGSHSFKGQVYWLSCRGVAQREGARHGQGCVHSEPGLPTACLPCPCR